jgi:hypothetical protein
MNRILSLLLRCALPLAATLVYSGQSSGAQVALPSNVRNALETNARILQQLTVAWRETFSTDLSTERLTKYTGIRPGSTQTFLYPREFRFVRQGDKFYQTSKQLQQVPPDPPYFRTEEYSFNGNYLAEHQNLKGTEKSTEKRVPFLTFRTKDFMTNRPEFTQAPTFRVLYFTASGFEVPAFGRVITNAPESLVLYLLHQEDSELQKAEEGNDGFFHLSIRANEHLHTFELDPKLKYAVHSYSEATAAGKRMWKAECKDFIEIGEDHIQLPKQIDCVFNAWNDWNNWHDRERQVFDQPFLTVHIDVTEIHNNPTADDFFEFQPKNAEIGTIVSDSRLPGASESPSGWVTYIVPADRSTLDQAVDLAVKRLQATSEPPHSTNSIRLLLIVTNVVLVMVLMLYLWWRKSS